MLNFIWAFMIMLGVIYAACTGHMEDVTNAALQSAGEAISLCITMAGVVALWMGLMEIAKEAGLIQKMTRGISPFLDFMFPKIPKKHPAREYIATNIIANILGLGWACTPAGLKAMEELANLEAERGTAGYVSAPGRGEYAGSARQLYRVDAEDAGNERVASTEMCNFLILNISSLQLIPVNMIAYRQQYGSVNPAGVIAPAIAATLVSTVTAIVYCKVKDRARRN
ncbi:MAG: nucleoside recognition protein [Acetatifactor sp.]|nr:nucleoside recognition protein [Acetatifactor sp.]MDE7113044.1 nucleoside recognition protein [Acetatifactor sp.]